MVCDFGGMGIDLCQNSVYRIRTILFYVSDTSMKLVFEIVHVLPLVFKLGKTVF